VASGYGVRTDIWHTYWIIEKFAPQSIAAMKAAHQQRGELDFAIVNRLHVPVAWGSMLLLAGVLALALWGRRPFSDVGMLAAVAALAILANAAACGALSNPHDRYGARIVWLATLVILMLPWLQRRAAHASGRSVVTTTT
jgi:hypothetical protein